MSFHDLPEDLRDVSITEQMRADLVDLFLRDRDREDGCISLLILDRRCRLNTPIVINDVPAELTDPPHQFLEHLYGFLHEVEGTVIFARGRHGRPVLTLDDLRWQEWIAGLLQDRLVASFLATPGAVVAYEDCDFSALLPSAS